MKLKWAVAVGESTHPKYLKKTEGKEDAIMAVLQYFETDWVNKNFVCWLPHDSAKLLLL